jgi:hypothetical protein
VSDLAGLIDHIFVGTEGDVSHECSVREIRAHCNKLWHGFQTGIYAAVDRHPAGGSGDHLEADAGGVRYFGPRNPHFASFHRLR